MTLMEEKMKIETDGERKWRYTIAQEIRHYRESGMTPAGPEWYDGMLDAYYIALGFPVPVIEPADVPPVDIEVPLDGLPWYTGS